MITHNEKCPYGGVGGVLWVRESWAVHWMYDDLPPRKIYEQGWKQGDSLWYKQAGDMPVVGNCNAGHKGKWRPSIFMPRWASRITLEITDLRVQRVQSITDPEALKEGVCWGFQINGKPFLTPRDAYKELWDSLNDKRGYSWESNCWVWAISFKRIK
jgi:hypothetical protein